MSEGSSKMEGMRQALLKMSSQTHDAWNTSIRNLQNGIEGMQRGVDASVNAVKNMGKDQNERDIICDSEDEALNMLKKMVESEKPRQQKRPQKWNFATVPLSCFDKTLDDVFMAFVKWAKIEDDTINVTRAFERLEAYATWMDNTGRDMIDPPLSTESINEAWKAWKLKVSYDRSGKLVIWFDVSSLDMNLIKSMPPVSSLRFFAWFSHFVMFDPHSQEQGCILVQNMGKIQLWTGITLVPPPLAHRIDRLTVGTMPVKMKQIYICESPQWASILLNIMKPFLSKIVRERIVFLEIPKVLEDILGQDCIPTDFVGTEGKLEKDIVWAAAGMGD